MTKQQAAAWLALCEESYRRAQRSGCPERYRAALAALREAERIALMLLAV